MFRLFLIKLYIDKFKSFNYINNLYYTNIKKQSFFEGLKMDFQIFSQHPIVLSMVANAIYDAVKFVSGKGANKIRKRLSNGRFKEDVKLKLEDQIEELSSEEAEIIKPIIEDEEKEKALDKILEKVEPKVIEYVEKRNSIDGLKEYVESLLKSEEFLKELGSEFGIKYNES